MYRDLAGCFSSSVYFLYISFVTHLERIKNPRGDGWGGDVLYFPSTYGFLRRFRVAIPGINHHCRRATAMFRGTSDFLRPHCRHDPLLTI